MYISYCGIPVNYWDLLLQKEGSWATTAGIIIKAISIDFRQVTIRFRIIAITAVVTSNCKKAQTLDTVELEPIAIGSQWKVRVKRVLCVHKKKFSWVTRGSKSVVIERSRPGRKEAHQIINNGLEQQTV